MRGKARDYSEAFETAWRVYGRREEKLRAYGEWLIQARLAGGETLLLPQILGALRWQTPGWAADGWKYAPYFERYLKRRKWEDERPPTPDRAAPVRAQIDRAAESTDKHLARINAYEGRQATPEELRALRGGK